MLLICCAGPWVAPGGPVTTASTPVPWITNAASAPSDDVPR
ncbi:hypothetical protein ACFQ1L_39780 [Phytohabitans flavus]